MSQSGLAAPGPRGCRREGPLQPPLFRPRRTDVLTALVYFVAASLAVSLTRFGGGVAFVWAATAVLIAYLVNQRRRRWLPAMVLCGLAGALATAFFGLGPAFALPLAAINLLEAFLAATLLTRARPPDSPTGSLRWVEWFLISAGLIAPAVAALLAGLMLGGVGHDAGTIALDFYTGHALGNITFIPLFWLVARGGGWRGPRGMVRGRQFEIALLLAVVAAATVLAFTNERFPLLFLPCGPIVLAVFRGRELGAAGSVVLLALIGGYLTTIGEGPVAMIDLSPGGRLQFFQFYLAAVVVTVLPIAADLANRSRLYRDLRHSEQRYRMMAEHSSDILMHARVDGRIRFVSPAIRQLGGYDPSELVGKLPFQFILPEDHEKLRVEHELGLTRPEETRTFDYRAITASGEVRWFETHSRATIGSNGRADGILSVIRDVTDKKEAERSLTAAALTDSLTGLANRRAFVEAATAAVETGGGTIVILDLDHFKRINDTHGHDSGDAVLQFFAAEAKEAIRPGDLAARLGGEEFALLFPATRPDSAAGICDVLRRRIAATAVTTAAGDIRFTFSGGLAALGTDGLEPAMKRADEALYRAKAEGRDRLNQAA